MKSTVAYIITVIAFLALGIVGIIYHKNTVIEMSAEIQYNQGYGDAMQDNYFKCYQDMWDLKN